MSSRPIIQIDTKPIPLKEIAARMKSDPRTLLKEGIPAFPIGNRWVVSPIALLEWMNAKSDEQKKGKGRRKAAKDGVGEMAKDQARLREMVVNSILSNTG